MSKPILCLDFDGVCHSYTSGWKGADNILDAPTKGAFTFIKNALNHFDVYIFSSRSSQPGGIAAMQDWFIKHNWPGTYLTGPQYLNFPTEKPAAFLTIDDRAITFTGEWPTMDELRNFKPWYKR
jgi:hypothetical protein